MSEQAARHLADDTAERPSAVEIVQPAPRILFLDNLRASMVLLVIMGHSALAYSGFAPWWYVDDSRGLNMPLVVFFALQEVFLMPAFLFTAGFFAFSTAHRKGAGTLFRSRVRSLAAPWALTIFLLCPSLQFVWNRHHGNASDYDATLVGFLRAAAQLRTGYVDGSGTDQFQQHHMWFISLLFCFLTVLFLIQRSRWSVRPQSPDVSPRLLTVLLLVAACDAVAIFASNAVAPSLFFFKVANIVQFQPVNLLTYALYFGLGVYASSRWWFSERRFPGRPWVWGVTAVVTALAYLTVANLKSQPGSGAALKVAFALTRATVCVSWFGWLVSTYAKYLGRQPKVVGAFARNSFTIYIVHMNIVVFLQAALAKWTGGSPWAKYLLVFPAATVLCYLVSRNVVERSPKLAVAAMVAFACAMVVAF